MELILVLLILTIILFFYTKKEKNLLTTTKKAFPKYTIIEKFGTVMVCEYDARNEPQERIFITVNKNKQKSIKKINSRIIAVYQKEPSIQQLKADLTKLLN